MHISEGMITKALKEKHENLEDIFAAQVKIGPMGSKIMDAVAIKKTWSPRTVIGYEIKVSRQDFLKDEKYPVYMENCNIFYFVAPKGVIKEGEIPEDAGLMIYNESYSNKLWTAKKAPYRDIPINPDILLHIMLFICNKKGEKVCFMKRKYIDELCIKYEDTPQGWNTDINDKRLPFWEKQREEYGFDERETWALDYSFILWFYERLRMYDEINIIDTTFHKFEYKGETLTLQDCINKMIEGCKIYLTTDAWNRTDEDWEKINDVFNIFALCWYTLWW